MAAEDITSAGVIQAINEFDSLGREAFLSKYGFGPALAYSLVYEGNVYDSKAIVGAAHGYDRPDLGPLTSGEFSGGRTGAAKVLESLGFGVETPPELIHLVVKWSEKFGANTVEEHRSVADKTGAVWWGLIGSPDRPKLAAKRIETISKQLDRDQPTHVFISGPTNWRVQLEAIATTRADVEEELIPSYYHEDWSYGLWVKLKDFQPIERSWLTGHLELASAPGKPLSEGALSNQTNPLIVRDLSGGTGSTTRVWWVCQGATRATTSDLGVLWAPKVAKDGTSRGFWRALEDARAGDIVVHYANNHIRGVSTVIEEAVDAPNPAGPSDNWQEGDGWLVNVDYRELDEAIPLASIPIEWRIDEQGPFAKDGGVRQGYFSALSDRFADQLAGRFPQLELPGGDSAITKYVEPQLAILEEEIAAKGLRLTPGTVRRYHVSLKTRGFVILAGISGGGKTWLAKAYADVVGAESLVVPVAPNWTTNEDLLGYLNPIDGVYRHTEFSRFLMRAASEYSDAQAALRQPRPFHLILDEMNLARVEYYFAKFLSAMETRSRKANAAIVLSGELEVPLPENLVFIGTVNIDETTFGFADKVYDRAQLIELEAPRESLDDYMTGMVFREALLEVWDAVQIVAPFAFRIVDEINSYVQASVAGDIDISWQRAFDEQLLQKVLPKIKGTDPRIGNALNQLVGLTDPNFPMTHERVGKMLENFNLHGFVSYF